MNDLLDTALQAFGVRKIAPTKLDVKLLTDPLGRALPIGGSGAQYVGTAPASWLGTGSQDLSANGYSNHGTAYSIISYILSTAAPIPWAAYAVDKTDNRAVKMPKHPLADLLYRPNPQQSWAELKMQVEGGYQVAGQAFVRRVRPGAGSKEGKTAELWCLVGRVDLLPLTGLGQFDAPTGYRHYDPLTGAVTDYPAEDILHLKTWNPADPHRGLSPIAAGIDAVTAAKAGLESRVRQYQNQGPPGIIFDESTEKWTPEQAGGVQRWFDSFLPGRRRQGNVPVISGKLGYLKLGLSPVDMDVLAAVPYDKDAIADLFHFPGQLLNGSKGTTFNNMGEAGAALYSRCVLPLETVFRDALNRWLGAEYGDGVYIDFDVSHIPELQPNKQKLAEWLNTAWYVPVRLKQEMLGIPVTWDGPEYLVPMNLVPAEELGAVPPAGADA